MMRTRWKFHRRTERLHLARWLDRIAGGKGDLPPPVLPEPGTPERAALELDAIKDPLAALIRHCNSILPGFGDTLPLLARTLARDLELKPKSIAERLAEGFSERDAAAAFKAEDTVQRHAMKLSAKLIESALWLSRRRRRGKGWARQSY